MKKIIEKDESEIIPQPALPHATEGWVDLRSLKSSDLVPFYKTGYFLTGFHNGVPQYIPMLPSYTGEFDAR